MSEIMLFLLFVCVKLGAFSYRGNVVIGYLRKDLSKIILGLRESKLEKKEVN